MRGEPSVFVHGIAWQEEPECQGAAGVISAFKGFAEKAFRQRLVFKTGIPMSILFFYSIMGSNSTKRFWGELNRVEID